MRPSTRYSCRWWCGTPRIDLNPYDRSGATQGPSAAIYIGMWRTLVVRPLYYATDGIFIVESVSEDAISGSFEFMAVHQEDADDRASAAKTVTVTGWFDQLLLVGK
jgi:hypothetical protein